MKNFASCHVHPSSLDTASTVEAFAKKEVELGTGALCATDHGTLQAAQQVYEIAKKKKLVPIVGLEAYFRDDDCPILKKMGVMKTTDDRPYQFPLDDWKERYPEGTYFAYAKYFHLTLHAMDYPAYLCLVRLLSKADERAEKHGSERKPLFAWPEIEEIASHNITAGTSCLIGMTQRHLLDQNNPAGAKAYLDRLHHLFNDRLYAEVFPHECTHNWVAAVFVEVEDANGVASKLRFKPQKKLRTNLNEEKGIYAEDLAQKFDAIGEYTHLHEVMNYRKWEPYEAPYKILSVERVEDFLQNECTPRNPNGDVQRAGNIFVMEMAKRLGIPILCSDDSHFVSPDEKIVQDVRLAQNGGNWRFSSSYHRQSSEEAWAYFQRNFPQTVSQATFESWVQNSYDWRDRFKGFKMDSAPSLPTKFFPKNTLKAIKELIQRHGRMQMTKPYVERLKQEIEILHRNGTIDLLPYFMIDEEVCRLYENQGLLTGAGRGSAAGLLLSYLLGITHIDPLKYGLSLERFITLDRIKSGKLPDVDQDLSDRDILLGQQTDVVEIEMEDGTKHILPEDLKVETDRGTISVLEAAQTGADIKPWWILEDQADTQNQP